MSYGFKNQIRLSNELLGIDNYFLVYTIQILERIMDTATHVIEIINSRWQANAQILLLRGLSHLLPTIQFILFWLVKENLQSLP